MTNSTEIFWEANGLSLHTYAWAVRTFGGRRYVPSTRRGENVVVPFKQGAQWKPKIRHSQALTLSMWMVPLNQDGTGDETMTMEQKLHDHWNLLLDTLDVNEQFPLVKRWYQNGEVREATAMAELLGGLEPTVSGGYRQEFDIELLLSDPLFYGGLTPAENVGSMDPALGDVETGKIVMTMTTPSSPGGTYTMRATFSDGNWIQYSQAGHANGVAYPIDFDFDARSAKYGTTYVNGLTTRNPDFQTWPTLKPGTTVSVTGAASATIRYQPAYR